jgi:DNA-directed RNA polymerase specialized sigma24 family protein
METNHRVPIERTTLEGLYSRVRRSPLRRFVAIDQGLEEIPSGLDAPDEGLAEVERTDLIKRARTVLARAVAALKPQDRRILKLRFCCGASIADIARTTGLKQKALYGRFDRLLGTLRSHLENSGIVDRDILEAIGRTEAIEP